VREHQRGRPGVTRGQSSSAVSFFLRGFRARPLPRLPAFPAPDFDGKEGVSGSSPEEGSAKVPHVRPSSLRTTCSSPSVRSVCVRAPFSPLFGRAARRTCGWVGGWGSIPLGSMEQ
jgi:hypothetical protein